MSLIHVIVTVLAVLSLSAPIACGGTEQDQRDRGLQTEADVAVPTGSEILNETEEEREKKNVELLDAAERKNFDQ